MSEHYIQTHFAEIKKHANDIETRLDDSYCTLEYLLKENRRILKLAQKHRVNYLLIDDTYNYKIEL